MRTLSFSGVALGSLLFGACSANSSVENTATQGAELHGLPRPVLFRAPAGTLPASLDTQVDGTHAAVLPNGRLVTPSGVEVGVTAPKPFGLALSANGEVAATINSGASKFSVTLIKGIKTATPTAQRVDLDATFMGVVFSPDGKRFYASGGENGNLWVGDTESATIVGSINLNGETHPLNRPLSPTVASSPHFKGAFPGNMALSHDGRLLYVVDQAGFQVHVIDTTLLTLGADASGKVTEPDNFASVVARIPVGRYPYGIALSADGRQLYVTHVGVFQYQHLTPAAATGDSNQDYPMCYPGAGYPEDTLADKVIDIKKVDPHNLPASQRDPDGIRCGYVDHDQKFTVPGLGTPNGPKSSSVYVIDVKNPSKAKVEHVLKPGLLVGQLESGIAAFSGSHPNSVVETRRALFVANGNNDSISVFDKRSFKHLRDIDLGPSFGSPTPLKGIQPVALALSPDQSRLYVAEAGINAIAVIALNDADDERARGRRHDDDDDDASEARVIGHIPTGWWPSSLAVSADGASLVVANAKGRGAGPNSGAEDTSPKHTALGTVNILPVPGTHSLLQSTLRVLKNNGFVPDPPHIDPANPVPVAFGVGSRQIKHVIFINKENATHDLMLGDITATRQGVPVNGEPANALGADASPNHHELALSFAFGDNFYLEPTVSSDGHRWLTDTYTTEFEETHWPASYGGRRRDAGDDPNVFLPYPGRLGFTDANASPEPQDYNVHGGIYLHLDRNHKSFVNFGNGFEFAQLDEDANTEPTGVREHVNVPMEKVVRDHSDHLFPSFNTHIPDAPLPEDPSRFSRFGRFKQVFEAEYVNRAHDECRLPSYVDLYYPNDHGGGPNDINANGPEWSFKRFVQDNDAALGLTVDLISNSPCWKDTVIFVVEDDTQNGRDHVDGYRSIFLAISPWVKHEYVTKTHLSLASIFKTTELILGTPPLNQYDVAATDLRDLFADKPDFTPYQIEPITYAARPNPLWRKLTRGIDFSTPDRDEDKLAHAIQMSEGIPHKPKALKLAAKPSPRALKKSSPG